MSSRTKSPLAYLRRSLFNLNFYRLHLSYFILIILISSVVFYGSGRAHDPDEVNGQPLAYIDALFLCASAMTATGKMVALRRRTLPTLIIESGLNTVNLGAISAFQQSILLVLILLGNIVFVSFTTVLIRQYMYKRKLAGILQHTRKSRRIEDDVNFQEHGQAANETPPAPVDNLPEKETGDSIKGSGLSPLDYVPKHHPGTPASPYKPSIPRTRHYETGFGGIPAPWESAFVQRLFTRPFKRLTQPARGTPPRYLSFDPSFDSRVCITPDFTILRKQKLIACRGDFII